MSTNEQATTSDTQQCIKLPPSVMGCIKALAADATLTAGERLTGVLMLSYGWAWYDRQSSVGPTALALPSAQCQEVCAQLAKGVPDDRIASVNLGLAFMNSGPSAQDT